MLEKIDASLQHHSQIVQQISDELQNYIYMAALLCYEAPLRENRLFVIAEGNSTWIAAYMVSRLRTKLPSLPVRLYEVKEETFKRYSESLEEMDVVLALSVQNASEEMARFLETAKEREAKRVVLCTHANSATFKNFDIKVDIPEEDPFRAGEFHLLVCNIIAGMIEDVVSEAS